MSESKMLSDFNESDKKIHPVETQWHYKILTKYGFVAKTKEAIGFVRSYDYEHPSGCQMTLTTGYHADYWTDKVTKETGYYLALEPYLTAKVGIEKE